MGCTRPRAVPAADLGWRLRLSGKPIPAPQAGPQRHLVVSIRIAKPLESVASRCLGLGGCGLPPPRNRVSPTFTASCPIYLLIVE